MTRRIQPVNQRNLLFLLAFTLLLTMLACSGGNEDETSFEASNESSTVDATPEALPNILLVIADDLGVDNVGAYGVGSDLPKTPTMDKLAADGVLFRSAWAYPVCSPTRATTNTGLHPFDTGLGTIIQPHNPASIELPTNLMTIAKMLSARGYATGAFGKWHLSPNIDHPLRTGYQYASFILGNPETATDTYFKWQHFIGTVDSAGNMQTQESTEEGYLTTRTTNDAINWIQEQTKPWFAYVAYNAPHAPFHAPPAGLFEENLEGVGGPNVNGRPFYKAMVEALDKEFGRLIGSLEPIRNNTVVIFFGDNGTPQAVTVPPFVPSHAKQTLFEGGINVPMIITAPHVTQPGSETKALAHVVDMMATVADMAGVNLAEVAPNVTDSISLRPYLEDPTRPSDRTFNYSMLFSNRPDNGPPSKLLPLGKCPDLSTPLCQEDIGFGGSKLSLNICGHPLVGGDGDIFTTATTVGGTPGAPATVLLSDPPIDPINFLGLFTLPSGNFAGATTVEFDAEGKLVFDFSANGPKPLGRIYQVFEGLLDQDTVAASNAVLVRSYETFVHTGRNDRYKLKENVYACTKHFFDLQKDPFEQTNLLDLGPLTAEQQAAFDFLSNGMEAIQQ